MLHLDFRLAYCRHTIYPEMDFGSLIGSLF